MRASAGPRQPPKRPVHIRGAVNQPARVVLTNAWIQFESARCEGWQFTGLQLDMWEATDSRFESCVVEQSSIDGGRLSFEPQSVYVNCSFRNSDLRYVLPGTARFVDCVFEGADLRGWICHDSEFVGCKFIGDLRQVVFYGRPSARSRAKPRRTVNRFSQNDFSRAAFSDVDFRKGVDIDDQIWPVDHKYMRVSNMYALMTPSALGLSADPG